MIKFSKEEIELCEKIEKKERKEINEGDWVVLYQDYEDGTIEPWIFSVGYIERDDKTDKPLCIKKWDGDHCMLPINFDEVTPLWTLSDCLEWLKSNIDRFQFSLNHFRTQGYCIQLWKGNETQAFYSDYPTEVKPRNKTLLEACLKAVLAVLEKQK